MSATTEAPFIITLALDEAHQGYFNQLRQTYFPEERNYLEAHVTLFHQLPGSEQEPITHTLHQLSRQNEEMELQVAEVKSIGRGVAFVLNSESLIRLHQRLAQQWRDWLIPQDRQKLWPHITVQNKVTSEEAKTTIQKLSQGFESFTVIGTGLKLWKYRGGPWEFVRTFPFGKTEKSYLSS